jgi:hypothetical protein
VSRSDLVDEIEVTGYLYRLIQVVGTGCDRLLVHIVGTGCDRLLVQVDSDRVTVAVVDSVTVTGCLHLAFIFQGGRMGQGKGVVSSFRLEPENQGVGASFRLDPEN